MEDRTISTVLKDLRHHAGLTQAALSKETSYLPTGIFLL